MWYESARCHAHVDTMHQVYSFEWRIARASGKVRTGIVDEDVNFAEGFDCVIVGGCTQRSCLANTARCTSEELRLALHVCHGRHHGEIAGCVGLPL